MTIGEEIVVLSANCQGLQNKNKQMDVLDYLYKTKASITCLQDTHWTPRDESNVRSLWKGDCVLNGFPLILEVLQYCSTQILNISFFLCIKIARGI